MPHYIPVYEVSTEFTLWRKFAPAHFATEDNNIYNSKELPSVRWFSMSGIISIELPHNRPS